MLVIHHLNNSRSQRIIWMLEELGLDYELKKYSRNPDMSAPSEMRRVHPLGKSPIVEHRTAAGEHVVLVETGAICEYLIEKAGGTLGPSPSLESRILYRQFLHYSEGSVMPVLFATLVASKIPLFGRVVAKRIIRMLRVHLDYIEDELTKRQWFAGDEVSAADIMMSFPLEAASSRGLIKSDHPSIMNWLNQIHERPAYRRALERGGAYAFA